MNVDGEQVWVPSRKQDLIAGLRRLGVSKIAGVPLRQVPKRQLVRAYCRERAQTVRRRRYECALPVQSLPNKPGGNKPRQLELFPRKG